MLSNSWRPASAAAALASLLLASASFAQEGAPPPSPEHGPPGAWQGQPPAAHNAAEKAQRLHDILQLRPDQQPALDAFLAAVQPPADLKDKIMRDVHDDRALPTPERMDHMLAHFDEVRAMLAARVEATKRFYAQLSPAQQKAFDAEGPHMGRFLMRMGPDGMHGGGWRHDIGPDGLRG